MLKFYLKLIFLFTPIVAKSQIGLSLAYSETSITGRNIVASVYKSKKEQSFSFGLKYHFDDPLTYTNNVYVRNLYAGNAIQYIGFSFEYRQNFKVLSTKYFKTFWFGDAMLTFNKLRNKYNDIDPITGNLFVIILSQGSNIYLDKHLGLGFSIRIHNKVNIFGKGGAGLNTIKLGKGDPPLAEKRGGFIGQYSFLGQIGLSYQLKDAPKPEKKKKIIQAKHLPQ